MNQSLNMTTLLSQMQRDHQYLITLLFKVVGELNVVLSDTGGSTTYNAVVIANEDYASIEVFGLSIWDTEEGIPDDLKSDEELSAFIRERVVETAEDIAKAGEALSSSLAHEL